MIVIDICVLLAAFRPDHSFHAQARPWLEKLLVSAEPMIVPDIAWVGFVRIATDRRIFEEPASVARAFDFVSTVTAAPSYRPFSGNDVLGVFRELCLESRAQGNLIPDAYLASVARAYACPIATFDRDFRRFEGLAIIEPK